jgi:DNA-binding transcriptional LysR family regulator
VRHLAATRPGLTVQLHEADTEIALDRLLRDDTDLVVGLDGEVRVDDPRFGRRALMVDPMDVALPAGHPLTGRPIRLTDLAGEDWILPPAGLCREIALRECAVAGFTPAAAHTADSYDAVLALVRAGLGIALVPRMRVPRPEPGMVVVALAAEQPRRHVALYARRAGDRAGHVRAVADALAEAAGPFSSP